MTVVVGVCMALGLSAKRATRASASSACAPASQFHHPGPSTRGLDWLLGWHAGIPPAARCNWNGKAWLAQAALAKAPGGPSPPHQRAAILDPRPANASNGRSHPFQPTDRADVDGRRARTQAHLAGSECEEKKGMKAREASEAAHTPESHRLPPSFFLSASVLWWSVDVEA